MQILKINSKKPQKNIIQKAAKIIRQGGLVVFPTETVYGLGANALDPQAVKKIFQAKNRPTDNPLIVHIAVNSDLKKIAKNIPAQAKLLASRFWPGPLTLILKKKKIMPYETTAGADTVAVRFPDHNVARALIKAAKTPIAAPSANLAGRPSATCLAHILLDLKDKVDLILDSGPSKIGLESTVLDLTSRQPIIWRPGGLSKEKIEKVLGQSILVASQHQPIAEVKSPGLKYRHYAPKAKLFVIDGDLDAITAKIKKLIGKYKKQGKKVGVMTALESKNDYPQADIVLSVGSRHQLKTIAKNLFKILRQFDQQPIDIILAENFTETGLGLAIMNRLKCAAVDAKTD